jgi:hypothetical protein
VARESAACVVAEPPVKPNTNLSNITGAGGLLKKVTRDRAARRGPAVPPTAAARAGEGRLRTNLIMFIGRLPIPRGSTSGRAFT